MAYEPLIEQIPRGRHNHRLLAHDGLHRMHNDLAAILEGQVPLRGPGGFEGRSAVVESDGGDLADAVAALPAAGGKIRLAPDSVHTVNGLSLDKPVRVEGPGMGYDTSSGAVVRAAAGVTGITVNAPFCYLAGFRLESESTGAGTDDGIRVAAGRRSKIELVQVDGFGRHGVHIGGAGNANLARLELVRSTNNQGNGFHIEGVDANACVLDGCDAMFNTGWGFWTGGNHNENRHGHASANAGGAFRDSGNSNAYFWPYRETGVDSTAEIASGSSSGLWFAPLYASPSPVVVNAAAATTWLVVERSGFRRQVSIDDNAGWESGKTFRFDSGVHAVNTFRLRNATDAVNIFTVNSARMQVLHPLLVQGNVGFYGTTPQAKPTVTGSTDSEKITSLISALATLGLITDSTT